MYGMGLKNNDMKIAISTKCLLMGQVYHMGLLPSSTPPEHVTTHFTKGVGGVKSNTGSKYVKNMQMLN